MNAGFSGGSLAVFTALTPAGAAAFAVTLSFVLLHRGLPSAMRERIDHMLMVPLGVAWAGFIVSATHLGTPANALHAAAGIGRSPLSDEVAGVVAFLFAAGVYWLYTFKASVDRRVAASIGAAAIVSCVVMVALMACAYSVPTVPSWDTWHTPVNLCLSAAAGGLALASSLLRPYGAVAYRWCRATRIACAASIALAAAAMWSYASFLQGVANNVACAADGVPSYGAVIVLFVALAGAGFAIQMRFARVEGWKAAAFDAAGCACVLGAVLMARIPFYQAYLSAGF